MNTRQKLTLGIAAIFMVTLTIVGVTYAYFVTRVTGTTTESVNVSTATIGSVVYGDGNGTITLSNVTPGAVAYKTFTVTNSGEAGASDLPYNIYYTTNTLATKPEFVHSSDDSGCYPRLEDNTDPQNVIPAITADSIYNSLGYKISGNVNATADTSKSTVTSCFNANAYNNITYTLYEYTGSTALSANFDSSAFSNISAGDLRVVGEINNQPAQNVKLAALNTNSAGAVATTTKQYYAGAENLSVAVGSPRTYILVVNYNNNGKNQNIENDAAVTVFVDVDI